MISTIKRIASNWIYLVVAVILVGLVSIASAEDWPKWRGPRGDGTWQGPKLPEAWPEAGLKPAWTQSVGGGYSGVIVAQGRVYLQDRIKEPAEVERVLCFDAKSGEQVWKFEYAVAYGELSYGTGPRAAPTVQDGHLYAQGALGDLHCFDAATGKQIWSKHLVNDFSGRISEWGFAASPFVYENLLIVQVGALPDGGVMALDRKTGDIVWRNLPDTVGYATPIVIDTAGGEQLICWTPENIHSLDPRTGKLYWSVPYKVTYGVAIATPIFQENIVFVAGYWEGSKAIELGDKPTDFKLLWEENRFLRGLMSQPLYRDGLGFLLDKSNGLVCFDYKTGEKIWDDDSKMTPRGRNPQATLVWMGDENRVIVLNSDGDLILVRLDREGYHEQSRTNIIGSTWAHPAYAGEFVYARSDEQLVCVPLLNK